MAAEEDEKKQKIPIAVDRDFVTVVCDGAYIHHLRDHSSFIFYQDQVMPAFNDAGNLEDIWSRLLMFEIRLSKSAAQLMIEGYEKAEKTRTMVRLLGMRSRNMWTGIDNEEAKGHKALIEIKSEEIDENRGIMAAFVDMLDRTSEDGAAKLREIIVDAIHSNMEEMEKIVEKYPASKDGVIAAGKKESQ
jgi:hypothetical protein